jgi:hypothetical protein
MKVSLKTKLVRRPDDIHGTARLSRIKWKGGHGAALKFGFLFRWRLFWFFEFFLNKRLRCGYDVSRLTEYGQAGWMVACLRDFYMEAGADAIQFI